jgi:hypothetical protein
MRYRLYIAGGDMRHEDIMQRDVRSHERTFAPNGSVVLLRGASSLGISLCQQLLSEERKVTIFDASNSITTMRRKMNRELRNSRLLQTISGDPCDLSLLKKSLQGKNFSTLFMFLRRHSLKRKTHFVVFLRSWMNSGTTCSSNLSSFRVRVRR